ncbi:MAG: helicase-exonuclease AddAB subunit AddB, partial [Clostridiales bacterium]|nr:helicase-exonuclease AddAB subunit AddB [Clostridiales bacterium]
MSLQLILGSSGSGKSHKLYKEIIDKSISHKDVNYLIVVPEQFTLQTQKEIVTKHPYNGTMNIDILSFLRLAHRVFEETGGNNRPVLEDTGKSMILRKVLAQSKDDLKFFGREAKKIGFVSELKSLISELFQYSVTKDDLERIGRDLEARPMLYNKLHDISVIYNGFREYLEEKYITQEEILDVLCDVISKSDLIKTSVIAFDGFTGFTPAQYKLLGLLMKLAKKVIVTVTIDEREDITSLGEEFELFHLSKKTIHNLYKIAEENNIKIDKPIYPDMANKGEVIRFRDNKALAFLERNLFRYPYKSYKKDQDQVRIHVAEDAKAEVSYVVRETQRLVRDEGYRYQDIAIITGDIGQYCNILEREFERANIPVFIDHKRELLNNPFVEMIRSMLDIVKNDFDYESVFRFLRCGLTDYSNDDLDILENYIIALGIRGKSRWEKEWKKTYRGQVEGELTRINEIREELVDFFTPISKILKDREKTVRDYTITIYDHIVKLNIAEKLEKYKQDFEAKNMFSTAKEYEQIYGIVIDLFEKLVELLGNEKLQLEEYIEILEAGFLEAKVGVIPPGLDQLVVGDIERTRLNKVKA